MSRDHRPNARPSKSVGFYSVMEAYSTTPNYPSQVETYRHRSPPRASIPPQDNTISPRSSDGQISPRNVSFGSNNIKRDEEKDKRQKYLTARYGQHQMMLIRKRLAVEDWLYEQLRDLYSCENEAEDHDCTLDLEDILNIDSDSERLQYIHDTLTDVKQPPDFVNKFVAELMKKAKTL